MSTATRATGCRCAGALSRARAPLVRDRWPAAPFLAGALRAFPAVGGMSSGASEPAGTGSAAPWLVSVTLPSYQRTGAVQTARGTSPRLEGECLGAAVDLGAPAPADRLDRRAGERLVLGEQPVQRFGFVEAAVEEQR